MGGTDSSEKKQAYWLHRFPTRRRRFMAAITDRETTPHIILKDKWHEVWLLADY